MQSTLSLQTWNEPNAKRRFRDYYGLDLCRLALELDVGYLIYYLEEKLKVQCIPLFRTRRLSRPYREPEKPKKSLWQRIVLGVIGFKIEEEENQEDEDLLLFQEEFDQDEEEW